MYCEKCGAEQKPQDKFCCNCGMKISPAGDKNGGNDLPVNAVKQTWPYSNKAALSNADTSVTSAQRWLLLGALALGFVFQTLLFSTNYETAQLGLWYAVFWLSYLALFHAVCLQQAKARPFGFLLAGAAAFLCIMLVFQSRGYSDMELTDLNLLAIPCLLMLHAQFVTKPLPKGQESSYILLFFTGFFIQPFQYIGRFFRSTGSLATSNRQSKRVWLGLLLALPAVAVVLVLLLSADAVMGTYARAFFEPLQLPDLLLRGFVLFVCAMLFYSFLYGAAWAKPQAYEARAYTPWSATAPNIVVGALLVVYAVFTAVQFVYLFGGHGLPEGLTYAAYAREGFNQLIWVAALNLGMFALCLCRVHEQRLLHVLLLSLLAATGVVLASAFTRLSLYICAYGLTFKRVQAFWFLCYLSAVLLLCGIRLYRGKLPLLRACTLLFILWYAALNIPNLNAWYAAAF